MKLYHLIRTAFLFGAPVVGTIFRIIRLIRRVDNCAIILPPAMRGSVGDDALFSSLCENLKTQGVERVVRLAPSERGANDNWGPEDAIIVYPGFSIRRFLRFMCACTKCKYFIVIGADVMDGFYGTSSVRNLEWCILMAYAGLKTRIVSVSFRETKDKAVLRRMFLLPKSVHIIARDPLSYGRLRRLCRCLVVSGADLAFLLHSVGVTPGIDATIRWCQARKREGLSILGVNFNSLVLRENSGNIGVEKYLLIYEQEMRDFLTHCPSCCILLIPHDFRNVCPDHLHLRFLYNRLQVDFGSRIGFVEGRLSANEVKRICAELTATFTGRMHLAIACLSQGIPVSAISYQGKVAGLFKLFGLRESLIVDVSESLRRGVISRTLSHLLESAPVEAIAVQKNLDAVVTLAHKNIECVIS